MNHRDKNYTTINKILESVRESREYDEWRIRNKASVCLFCDSVDDLQLHHVGTLFPVVKEYYDMIEDEAMTYKIVCHKHANDEVMCETLCDNCHNEIHKIKEKSSKKIISRNKRKYEFKQSVKDFNVDTSLYSIMPNELPFELQQGKRNNTGIMVGLIGFKALFGIGWHIINKGFKEKKMIECNCNDFARLINCTPGSSFKKSLQKGLESLYDNNIVTSYQFSGKMLTMCISDEYKRILNSKQWFYPMSITNVSRISSLSFLHYKFRCTNKFHSISRAKLALILNTVKRTPSFINDIVEDGMKQCPWYSYEFNNDIFSFKLDQDKNKKKKSVPVTSLRKHVSQMDVLQLNPKNPQDKVNFLQSF